MKDRLYRAFDDIKAEEEIKKKTLVYLRQYDQKATKAYVYFRAVIMFVCLLVFLSIGGISYKIYFTPSSYLDIDINPSIEIVINSWGRVIGTFAYNEEGGEILDYVELKHQSYADAFVLLMDAVDQEGYLADDALLSVTVQSKKKEQEMLDAVKKQLSNILDSKTIVLEEEIYAVDDEIRSHAHESGISPAKYLAILELLTVDSEITVEECQGHSIRELREMTQQHNENHRDGKNTETDGNDYNHGSNAKGHSGSSGNRNKEH